MCHIRGMRRNDICLYLGPADRTELQALITNRNTARNLVWRSEIVLATADGHGTFKIVRRARTSKPTVWRWQGRYLDEGVDGLKRDKTRPDCGPLLGEFRINADPAHLHGRVDHCLLTDRSEGPYPLTNSLHPQLSDIDTMPKARGSAGGHAARKDSDMRIPRAWVAIAGIVSCMLMLQGCGALQGCPDRTTICRMM